MTLSPATLARLDAACADPTGAKPIELRTFPPEEHDAVTAWLLARTRPRIGDRAPRPWPPPGRLHCGHPETALVEIPDGDDRVAVCRVCTPT